MPAKLKVQKNGLVVDEYEIKKQEILIGKGEHCDIVLNYPGIGREMARLTAEKDGFYIADVSVQGVFIDNQRITRQRVNPGQEINCGAVQLVLVEEDGFRDQASSATMLWEAAGFAVPPITAYLVSKGKPEEAHVISTEEFVIGRGVKDCQLPVVDNAASKRHARIARAGEKFLLADLNSTNGTYLNAQKVTDVIELKEGDEIRIGHAVFIFRKQLDSSQKPVSPPPANLIDMEQIVKQTDDMLPKAALPETPAKAIASDKKRMRLLIGAVAVAVLFLILIIALKPHGPKLDPARVSAIESLFRDGKLDDARRQIDELMKTFPSDQRLKLLVGRIEDAKKAEISDRISSLIDQAKERENALDILAATDLWAQVLQATPDNAEIQKKFCAAAYRIALVYEGELPESDKVNASRYLELIQKLVKKESASDYDTAMKLLDTLKK